MRTRYQKLIAITLGTLAWNLPGLVHGADPLPAALSDSGPSATGLIIVGGIALLAYVLLFRATSRDD